MSWSRKHRWFGRSQRLVPGLIALGFCAIASHFSSGPLWAEAPAPVVLELFTSQGCSSCPPADKILRRLGRESDVIALSFHVDYWNRLGWTDPFSQPAWTRRQERYAQQLGKDNLYTPQIVVDGRIDTVGSDVEEIVAAIDRRRRLAKKDRPVDLRLAANLSETKLEYSVEARGLESGKRYQAELFLTESGLVTEVPLGENANRTLYHDFVVRLGETVDLEGGQGQLTGTMAVDRGFDRERLALVVLVRSRAGQSIVGAASIPIDTPSKISAP